MLLFQLPRQVPVISGESLPGATATFYLAGTDTIAEIYSDPTGTVAANPQTATASGVFPPIWLSPYVAVDVEIKNAAGSVVGARAQCIDAANSSSGELTAVETAASLTAADIDDTYANGVDVGYVNAKRFKCTGAGSTSDQVTLQRAIDIAYASGLDCYIPEGTYLVTGLILPALTDGTTDDRERSFELFGAGFGEPFKLTSASGGTTIKSSTNAPVLRDIKATTNGSTAREASTGTLHLRGIRFEGSSDDYALVQLSSFYGTSSVEDCVFYQKGDGNGLDLLYGATWEVLRCYALNSEYSTDTLGTAASRTGIGFLYEPTSDMALATFRKCTSRGFKEAYYIGGGVGVPYSVVISECECSVNYNGIVLDGARCAVIENCYFEGGDGGKGIDLDGSDYTTIQNNLIFSGYAVVIDDSDTTNKGTLVSGNQIALGAVVNAIGIDCGNAGYTHTYVGNGISYTLGTAGVVGVKITGTDAHVNLVGTQFDPPATWTGSGSYRILDTSTSGVRGVTTVHNGDTELTLLSRGAVSYHKGALVDVAVSVSAGLMTLPAGSYFTVTTSVCGVTVSSISGADVDGRLVRFRIPGCSTTFDKNARLVLSSAGSFMGPGMLTLLLESSGGLYTGYETGRVRY